MRHLWILIVACALTILPLAAAANSPSEVSPSSALLSGEFPSALEMHRMLHATDEEIQKNPDISKTAFGWETIALELAKGAVAKIGGEILGAFLGTQDLKSFANDILLETAKIIRKAIQEEALAIADRTLSEFQRLYPVYDNLGEEEVVDDLLVLINRAVEDYERQGWIAHHAYMFAASTQFAAIQDMYGDTPEVRRTIASLAAESIKHVEPFPEKWKEWHWDRYEVRRIRTQVWIDERGRQHVEHKYIAAKDGRAVGKSTFQRHKVVDLINILRRRDWDTETFPKYVAPSNRIVEEWNKLVAQAE